MSVSFKLVTSSLRAAVDSFDFAAEPAVDQLGLLLRAVQSTPKSYRSVPAAKVDRHDLDGASLQGD